MIRIWRGVPTPPGLTVFLHRILRCATAPFVGAAGFFRVMGDAQGRVAGSVTNVQGAEKNLMVRRLVDLEGGTGEIETQFVPKKKNDK